MSFEQFGRVRAQLRARQFSGGDPADISSLDVDQDRRLRRFPQPEWLPLCVRDAEARRLDVTTAAAVSGARILSSDAAGRSPKQKACRIQGGPEIAPQQTSRPSVRQGSPISASLALMGQGLRLGQPRRFVHRAADVRRLDLEGTRRGGCVHLPAGRQPSR
jgi:hypothetical protein